MIDHILRQPKERVLTPVAYHVGRIVSPTTITLVSFGFGLLAAWLAWRGWFGWALGVWLLNRTIDGLDGTVARVHNLQSDWGGYVDILLDTVIYALIPTAIVLHDPTSAKFVALVVMLASFYINSISWSYLAAILEKRHAGAKNRGEMTSITMPTGLIEGTETVLFFSVFLLMPAHSVWLYWLMVALVAITIGQRLIWAKRAIGAQA